MYTSDEFVWRHVFPIRLLKDTGRNHYGFGFHGTRYVVDENSYETRAIKMIILSSSALLKGAERPRSG